MAAEGTLENHKRQRSTGTEAVRGSSTTWFRGDRIGIVRVGRASLSIVQRTFVGLMDSCRIEPAAMPIGAKEYFQAKFFKPPVFKAVMLEATWLIHRESQEANASPLIVASLHKSDGG